MSRFNIRILCRRYRMLSINTHGKLACPHVRGVSRTISALLGSIAVALSILPALTNAAPLSAPTGLCLDPGNNCASPRPSGKAGTKWHPGHYLLIRKGQSASAAQNILTEPNIKGVQIRYLWSELEPRKGVYDFSRIESDLRYLQRYGKRLVAQILYKGSRNPVPEYLKSDPEYRDSVVVGFGENPKIWQPELMDRYIALYKELGKRFNDEPYFEAIAGQETSLGRDITSLRRENRLPSYSDEAYLIQLQRLITAQRAAFPNTVVLKYANFMPGNRMPRLAEHAYKSGAGMAGPDIIPHELSASQKARVPYLGKMPLGDAVQDPELCGKEGCNLPETLYQTGVNTLKLNYIFWVQMGTNKGRAYSFEYGILPTINSHDGAINASCPENIAPCITD